MNCCSDFFVPLIAAFIGGLLTLSGVIITLHTQKKEAAIIKKDEAKPYLCCLESCKNMKDIETLTLKQTSDNQTEICKIMFIIKNTDNGIAFIKELKTENNVYTPIDNNIIDKNETVKLLIIVANKKESLKNWELIFADIYDNNYSILIDLEKIHGVND